VIIQNDTSRRGRKTRITNEIRFAFTKMRSPRLLFPLNIRKRVCRWNCFTMWTKMLNSDSIYIRHAKRIKKLHNPYCTTYLYQFEVDFSLMKTSQEISIQYNFLILNIVFFYNKVSKFCSREVHIKSSKGCDMIFIIYLFLFKSPKRRSFFSITNYAKIKY